MKRILLIGTGGTIASKETGDGLSPGLAAEEIVNYVPEVKDLCEIEVFQLCNIDSTNMNPRIWTTGTISGLLRLWQSSGICGNVRICLR